MRRFAGFLWLVACAPQPADDAADASAARQSLTQTPAISLETAIERTVGAFHASGGELSALSTTMGVRTDGDHVELSLGPEPEALVEIRLGPTQIHRGEWRAVSSAQPRRLPDGSLARTELERWRTSGDRVEQSWSFGRPPAGQGDLVVEVPMSNVSFVASTPTGLHFRHDGGSVGLRYGHATWIDAAGVRTDVPATWRAGVVSTRVPDHVVRRSVFPAVLDPVLGPEIEIDEPVIFSPGSSTRDSADVAFDGTNYLVVWSEQAHEATTLRDVWGQRVSAASGEVLDGHGFQITSRAGSHERSPSVAFDGTNFMVAYDNIDGVRVTRVAPSGAVLDPTGIVVHTEDGTTDIAYGGGVYFVVWTEIVGSRHHIFGRRVAPDGTVLDAAPQLLSAGGLEYAIQPAVAYGGGRFLAMYFLNDSVFPYSRQFVRRVSVAGVIEDPAPVQVSPTRGDIVSWSAVASDGTNFLAVTTHSAGMEARRIAGDGTFLDPAPIAIAGRDCNYPTVAWDGTHYTIGYVTVDPDPTRAYMFVVRRLDPTTMTLGPELALESTGELVRARHGIVAHSGKVFAAWASDYRVDAIRGARLDWATGVQDAPPLVMSQAANRQEDARIVWNGSSHLLMWQDNRFVGTGTYTMRLGPDGVPLDTIGARVTDHLTPRYHAVAHGGEWITWWMQSVPTPTGGRRNAVFAQRILADGSFAGSPYELPFGSNFSTGANMEVVSNGTVLLLAWYETSSRVRAMRASIDGTALDAAPIVITNSGGSIDAAVLGGRFFVSFDGSGTTPGARVIRIEGDGTVLDTVPLAVTTSSDSLLVHITAGVGELLVSWLEFDDTLPVPEYRATRMLPDGSLTGGVFSLEAARQVHVPAPAWDGARWPIAWVDDLESIFVTYAERSSTRTAGPSVVANRMSGPAIASDGAGSTLIAYSRWVETPHRQERLFVRLLTDDGPNGAACTSSAECESGFCVDSVCCDSACGGSATDDCQVCAVSAGATDDGVCTIVSGTECRAGGTCDPAEHCDGVTVTCPADVRAADGTECDDGAVCDGADVCMDGACIRGALPDCDDGDVCTADACSEPAGCSHTSVVGCCNIAGDCDDGDACTADVCTSNACAHEAIASCCGSDADCDDGDDCSEDRCDATSGTCDHDPLCCAEASDCDDGDVCTSDSCGASGICEREERSDCCRDVEACDDGDACTSDSCAESGMCVHDAIDGCGDVSSGCGCRAVEPRPNGPIVVLFVVAALIRRRGRARGRAGPLVKK